MNTTEFLWMNTTEFLCMNTTEFRWMNTTEFLWINASEFLWMNAAWIFWKITGIELQLLQNSSFSKQFLYSFSSLYTWSKIGDIALITKATGKQQGIGCFSLFKIRNYISCLIKLNKFLCFSQNCRFNCHIWRSIIFPQKGKYQF